MKPQTSKHSACLTTLLLVLLNMGWLPDATAGPAVYYFHNDHLGTPRVVTDRLRDVRWRADYTPFGETIMHTEQIEMPLRMPGQYYDSESGLHYNYYRDYDPGLGRYIQSDPIGLLGGLNTYVYARNDPLSLIDPFGLHGQMSRIKGRQRYDGVQRGNVVGSVQLGLLVISASEQGGFELGAAAMPGFNASLLACTSRPPPPRQCETSPADPVTSAVVGSGLVAGGVGGMPCVGIGIGTPRVSITASTGVR
jgi:RHS repeat-associated protein